MDVERGAALRRRQRRLRSWWRHEQQTVAAVLATVTHHSHSKVGTAYDAPRGQKNVTSTRVRPAEYFELSSDDGRPTGRERPAALLEPWPQEKTERHDGIAYELVLALDAPVLQTVEQLPNVVQFFATQLPVVAEPVIEVPKILPDDVPVRTAVREKQLVEQLVEVPTVVSWSLLQRLWSTTYAFQFLVVEGEALVYKVFFPDRVQHRYMVLRNAFLSGMWSRSLFLGLVKAFKIFSQDKVHPLLLTIQLVVWKLWMSLGTGFFALFPKFKKVRHNFRTRGRNCLRTRAHGRQLLMTRPWCLRRRRRRRKRRSPRTSLSGISSTCSTMGIGGGASGSSLDRSIAGGWPLPMGPRLAILSGGLHGSSAEGQDDDDTMVLLGWCLVRQWIHVPALTYCGGASFRSSSKWWTLLLFTETVTHSSNCARSSTSLSWRRGRFLWSRAADHSDSPIAVY